MALADLMKIMYVNKSLLNTLILIEKFKETRKFKLQAAKVAVIMCIKLGMRMKRSGGHDKLQH